ncbi:protein CPR-5 [Cinnamomum micranthum f. kanehirae]|uniref:Protein CPR-5 n=1 Tax=Cinnamomum micranthum f. kanehirae TaxID=337451 RepID=A0A443PQ01_9MAGN|nr:protein CPR-5 [Cinnamomum micranthum f. kanehirae]
MEISFPPLAPCSSSCNSPSSKHVPPSSSQASRSEHGGRPNTDFDEEVTSPALLLHQVKGSDPSPTAPSEPEPDPTVSISPSVPSDKGKAALGKTKRPQKASSLSSSSSSLRQRRARVDVRRRISPGFRGRAGENNLHDLALPLGMSMAAVISQFLERNDVGASRISTDHLSMICTSTVRESIESVFGDRFDTFMRNFEKSFGSTLKTLRLLKEASLDEQEDSFCTSYARKDISEQPSASCTDELPAAIDKIHEDIQSTSLDHQLVLRGQITQELANVSKSAFDSGYNVLSTYEKSVMEQARSNDLKEFEIALVMKKLQLKTSQLALSSDANLLERFKLSMGISKASFKEEKLKNQLQDTRHAELLKKCIDCLVAGLLIMSTCLFYGTYIYSYKRISEATYSCTSAPKGSKSWWLPNPMASVSSSLHTLRCHVMVVSRMLFGLLMILALAYSLLQRSASSRQTMPVTFILLLLGVACGFAGKMCVDTLGGSGYIWLLHWEAFCSLHFFANVFTSALFYVLHGPVSVCKDTDRVIFPYWMRRVAFYSTALLFLPILCGLMPFASIHDWKEHFSSLTVDKLFDPILGDGS